jgi:NADH:ubiquinone oxidoreductase subunit 6 (subunit J)
MVVTTQAQPSGFKSWARKVYNPLGFKKGYNFALWFIFGGALLGFTLARFTYLDFSKSFCPSGGSSGSNGAAPGECYYYLNYDRYKIGILLHLAGILPAAILAIVQFTPFIRHRWIIVHRITGYAALLLYSISLAGALMIARHAFGGGLDIQVWVGFVGIGALLCFIISYINIKRLQIEQHRAWMLRGWFYVSVLMLEAAHFTNKQQAGSIVTTRIIMILAAIVISKTGEYNAAWPCSKIESALPKPAMLLAMYPACAAYINGSNPGQSAVVLANLDGDTGVNAGAALNMSFGMALWLATSLHAIGVELYVGTLEPHICRIATNTHPAEPHTPRSTTSTTSQLPTPNRGWNAQPWVFRLDC